MPIVEIKSLDCPGTEIFARLTERQLRRYGGEDDGIFIVESPKVIRVALRAGYEPVALLCERRHIEGDARDIVEQCQNVPLYTGDREVLGALTGYELTRGVLCAMRRRALPGLAALCEGASRVVVVDNVVEATNIGSIFRSAAALGADAVFMTKNSCDPLTRRAVRVSMGSVFLVPWTWIDSAAALRRFGFKTAAMALAEDSVELDDAVLNAEPKLAIVMGTEGEGLPTQTIQDADYVVRIPMRHGVDSLNVAACSAVAMWQLCARRK